MCERDLKVNVVSTFHPECVNWRQSALPEESETWVVAWPPPPAEEMGGSVCPGSVRGWMGSPSLNYVRHQRIQSRCQGQGLPNVACKEVTMIDLGLQGGGGCCCF